MFKSTFKREFLGILLITKLLLITELFDKSKNELCRKTLNKKAVLAQSVER